jgi:APA family basic amino acid/polyamine antiporter
MSKHEDKPIQGEKKIFVREATGLVRDLSWFDGMIMNLAYFNIAAASFLIFGEGSFYFPGSNMVITIGLIGLLVDIPLVIAYSMFSGAMPRSGGDYIFVSRSLFPALGFATGAVFFVFLSAFSIGQNSAFFTTLGLSPMLAGIGSVSGNSGLLNLASSVLKSTTQVEIGVVLLIIVFFLLMIRPSMLAKVMLGLFVIAFLGYPILYTGTLAFSTHSQFVSAFNSYSAAYNTSYTGIISSAAKAGASLAPPTFYGSLAALPIVYATLAFPQSSTYISGETKRATRQVPIGLTVGLVVICATTAIMGYFTYNVFGYNFVSATTYYGLSGAPGYPLPGSPFTDYFLTILQPNLAFNWFMLVSIEAWEILLMITFGLMASRFLFASAFDRVIPGMMADVSDRFHTPIKANVVTIIVAFVFLYLTAGNFLGTYVNSITAWTSGYIIVMISAIVFPFMSKDLFARAPSYVQKKIGGLPVMSLFGILGAVTLSVVFYFLLRDPAVSGASQTGVGIVTVVYLLGIAGYYVVRSIRKRRGIDLGLVFKEIPPE